MRYSYEQAALLKITLFNYISLKIIQSVHVRFVEVSWFGFNRFVHISHGYSLGTWKHISLFEF